MAMQNWKSLQLRAGHIVDHVIKVDQRRSKLLLLLLFFLLLLFLAAQTDCHTQKLTKGSFGHHGSNGQGLKPPSPPLCTCLKVSMSEFSLDRDTNTLHLYLKSEINGIFKMFAGLNFGSLQT